MAVEEAAAQLPGVAGGGEQGAQLGGGVGLADGDGAVVAGETAGVDERKSAGERVVGAGALEVVDEDGEAADAEGFAEERGGLVGIEVVEEETAADDVDAFVGEREGQGVALKKLGCGEMRRPGRGEVGWLAVEEDGVEGDSLTVESGCGGGKDGGAAGGNFEDGEVAAVCGGLLQEETVDAVAAEPAVDEAEGAQGAGDFRGGAVVFVEPLAGRFALEGHEVDCLSRGGIRQTVRASLLTVRRSRRGAWRLSRMPCRHGPTDLGMGTLTGRLPAGETCCLG